MEVWKEIEGFNGDYSISNYGNVYCNGRTIIDSLGRKRSFKPFEVKQQKDKKGYFHVHLWGKNYLVHRLVATAFLSNQNNYPCVNHKDENPSNNSVGNLEWCTYEHNNNWGTFGSRVSKSLLSHPDISKEVLQFSTKGELIKKHNSICGACRETKATTSGIILCCKGKQRTAGGYMWKYANPLQHTSKQKTLKMYNKSGELVGVFLNAVDAEIKTGISATNIRKCFGKNPHKTAGGYRWERE